MGADYSFYVKTIETHARAFFKVIIFSISSVYNDMPVQKKFKFSAVQSPFQTPTLKLNDEHNVFIIQQCNRKETESLNSDDIPKKRV